MFSSTTFSLQVVLASTVLAQTFNCILEVPANPLSADGLATPYKLSDCDQTQFATEANFVEAAILDPATGALQYVKFLRSLLLETCPLTLGDMFCPSDGYPLESNGTN
jgi:hypothetical protein